MKKIISLGLVLTILLLITGCGSSEQKKPEDMNQTTYDNGLKVLDTMDKFLDDELSLDETADKIITLWDAMEGSDPLDSLVKSTSYIFAQNLRNSKANGLDISKFKGYREDLAGYLKGEFKK